MYETKLDLNILKENLNEKVSYYEFFSAFGYSDKDRIYFRWFDDTKQTEQSGKRKCRLDLLDDFLPTLHRYNGNRFGIFFVVNGGGDSDKEVIASGVNAKAQFVDFDDCPFEEQIRRLNEFPLEPSIILRTKKSLHPYWLLKDGEMKKFREIQQRLIQHFGTDPVIQNESRVMRLYGFNHCKTDDPVLVRLIKFNPEIRYTQQQLCEVLPELKTKFGGSSGMSMGEVKKTKAGLIAKGSHHFYVVKRIGHFLNVLGDDASDEMILNLIWTDYQQHCDGTEDTYEKFRNKYIQTIQKFRANDEANNEANEAILSGGALQNLPALLRAVADGYPVYYVSKTEDIKALEGFHYTATTAGAVPGWKSEYAKFFTGARVVIIPSNDTGYEKAAARIARDLKRYAFEVKVVPKLSGLQKGGVYEFLEKEGHTREEFKEAVNSVLWELCPWAYVSKNDTVNIKPSTLAVNFSKVSEYIIVRNPLDDNDLFYGFEGGVYRRWNKAQVKSALRRFVPVEYQKDAQIAEAQRTLFELGEKIHSFDELDSNERYINFQNGLYDLEERKLIPHNPKILSTVQLRFDYSPDDENMPVFTRFMMDFFTKENGTVDYNSMKILQEFCGLAISNVYVYRAKKALFLCSLRGNTGKSVLMNLMQYILGEDNVTSVPIQHMNENTGRFTMGTALGKRMIINGDQTESDVGDSSYFKQLTGGDRTKMENKNQKPLMVRYRGGIMIGCNGLPSFTDDKGDHVFERLLLIMCTNVIPEEKRDSTLLDKMKPESPAIINWFLQGLHRIIDNGYKFSKSEAAEEAIHEYRESLDSVYRFIHEYRQGNWRFVITRDRSDVFAKSEFYQMYAKWCYDPENEVNPIKRKNINQRLEKLGCEIDPHGNVGAQRGVYVIRGLKWTDNAEGAVMKSFEEWQSEHAAPFEDAGT